MDMEDMEMIGKAFSEMRHQRDRAYGLIRDVMMWRDFNLAEFLSAFPEHETLVDDVRNWALRTHEED